MGIIKLGRAYKFISAVDEHGVIDNCEGKIVDGTREIGYAWRDGAVNQIWIANQFIGDTTWVFVSKQDPNYALDNSTGSNEACIWTKHGGTNQQWTYERFQENAFAGYFVSKSNQNVLQYNGASQKIGVVPKKAGSKNQLWVLAEIEEEAPPPPPPPKPIPPPPKKETLQEVFQRHLDEYAGSKFSQDDLEALWKSFVQDAKDLGLKISLEDFQGIWKVLIEKLKGEKVEFKAQGLEGLFLKSLYLSKVILDFNVGDVQVLVKLLNIFLGLVKTLGLTPGLDDYEEILLGFLQEAHTNFGYQFNKDNLKVLLSEFLKGLKVNGFSFGPDDLGSLVNFFIKQISGLGLSLNVEVLSKFVVLYFELAKDTGLDVGGDPVEKFYEDFLNGAHTSGYEWTQGDFEVIYRIYEVQAGQAGVKFNREVAKRVGDEFFKRLQRWGYHYVQIL